LTDEEKAVRWNVARESALLSGACASFVVVPMMFAVNLVATRVYNRYWLNIINEISKTKTAPQKVF